jgi:YD repeat-containing protein
MNSSTLRLWASIFLSLLLGWCLLTNTVLAAGGGGGKSGSAKPQQTVPGKQFDSQGRYSGRVEADGKRYDGQGRYLGRTDESGRHYDAQGRYMGRIEAGGRQYDAQGRYVGRADSNGRLYDEQGRYQGRIDAEGRQYDAQGRYTGRLEPGDKPVAVPGVNGMGRSVESEAGVAATATHPAMTKAVPATTQTIEGNRAVAPFVFCNYGDKDCGK